MSVTPRDIAIGLHKTIIDDNTEIYRQLFATTEMANATDEYWKGALALYQQLNESQRDVFFSVIRQVAVDTVSNVLALFDGTATLEPNRPKLELIADGKAISGDLQDEFLAMV